MKSSLMTAAAVMLVALSAPAQTPVKVGIISVQGAIVGTKDGQKASQELEAKMTPKRKELEGRQQELTQLEDQYQKGGNLMSEDKRNQLARDIDDKKKRLQRDVQDAQEELNQEQQRVLQGLGQRVYAVIEKYAKDNGYTMVLDVSGPNSPVLYASSGVDITPDIIALYDKNSVNGGPATMAPTSGAKPTPGTATPKPAGTAAPK